MENFLAKGFSVGEFKAKELVAFILVMDACDALEVMLLATAKSSQRSGLMKSLFEKWTQSVNKKIWLEVHEKNTPAIGFYESVGFKQTHLRKSYYPDGGSALLMEKAPVL